MWIAVKAIEPQCVANHSNGSVRVVFLLGKDAAYDGRDAQGGEDTGGEAGAVDRFRKRAPGELPRCGDVGTHRRESQRGTLVGGDLGGGDAQLQAISEAVAQKDEVLGIAKRQGAQEDAFHEREDGGGSPDAQREGKDNGQ